MDEKCVDPDQLASLEVSRSGSTLFSKEDIEFEKGMDMCTIRSIKNRAVTFTKFCERLHEFQKPKRFHLHKTSGLIFS